MYEIEEVMDYVDENRKSLKVTRHTPAVQVYGGTWKIWLDKGQKELNGLIDKKELSLADYRMFTFMVENMNRVNVCDMKQKGIADVLNQQQSFVNRKIRKLRSLDLVRGNMVNPGIAVFGDSKLYPDVLDKWNSLKEKA